MTQARFNVMDTNQQRNLATLHRLMRELDSLNLPGQYDMQAAAVLLLSGMANQLAKDMNMTRKTLEPAN